MGWWCAGANIPFADVGPCDGLKIRHHQSGRDSLAAHVSTKDSDASSAEIEEIVEIAADRSRGQRSTRNSYPAQHRRYAWKQVFLNASRNLKFALDPQGRCLLLLQPLQGDCHFVEVGAQVT